MEPFSFRYPRFGLVALAFTLFFASWKHWAEFWGDSGFNLYTFWQIGEGKLLYRDLYYFHGPLAPLLNGWAFRWLGQSVLSIAFFNLVLIVASVLCLYHLIAEAFRPSTAFVAGVFFLFVFAFAQNTPSLSYNFVLPYKPEAVFAILFSVGAFRCAQLWLKSRRAGWAFLLGSLWGACALLSIEAIAALSVALLGFTGLLFWQRRPPAIGSLGVLAAGLASPIILCILYFRAQLPWSEALTSTFAVFVASFTGRAVFASPLYVELSGLDFPLRNAWLLCQWGAALGLVVAGIWCLASLARPAVRNLCLTAWPFFFLLPAWLGDPNDPRPQWWWDYPRAMPAALLVFFFLLLREARQAPSGSSGADRDAVFGAFVLFSFILLGKMFLRPQVAYYGFFLAGPAAMSCAVFLIDYLPSLWSGWPREGATLRAFFLITTLSLCGAHFVVTRRMGERQSFVVGHGANEMLIDGGSGRDEAGLISALALRWVEENIPASEKIQFLPEADILNFLSRRERPTPYHFSGFVYRVLGENFLLGALRDSKPAYIGVVSNDYSNIGYGVFGADPAYGQKTRRWIEQNYEIAKKFGDSPYGHYRSSVWIYRRVR